jgi:hypothetical protein
MRVLYEWAALTVRIGTLPTVASFVFAPAVAHTLTNTFQAIVHGVLPGATELSAVSSLL